MNLLIRNPWLLFIIAALFAAGWTIPDYIGRMSAAGHYQFFPLVYLFVGILLYLRLPRMQQATTEPDPQWLKVWITAMVVALLASHLLSSHLIGLVGMFLALILVVYGRFGRGGVRVAMPALILLVFAIPLPMKLDQSLIVEMQFFASYIASLFLDGIGFVHFREGVTLVTKDNQFLTEEACSGIRSLFSSLFVVAAVCVWSELSKKRTIFNVLQTILWVMLGNALRVVAVVILADRVSPWFATGIGHELLGMAVFAFILFMVASTDQIVWLFSMYRPTVPLSFRMQVRAAMRNLRNVTPVAAAEVEATKPSIGQVFGTGFPLSQTALIRFFAVLIFVGLVGLRVTWVHQSGLQAIGIRTMPTMDAPNEDDMPAQVGSWARVGFEHVHRDFDGLLAENSYIWTYRSGELTAQLSIDRPWAEWHNLHICYRGRGWNSEPDYFIEAKDTDEPRYSELTLERAGRHGFVLFSAVDRQGREIAPAWRHGMYRLASLPSALLMQISGSLGFGVTSQFSLANRELPVSTIQVYSEGAKFSDKERELLREFFLESRREFQKSLNGS